MSELKIGDRVWRRSVSNFPYGNVVTICDDYVRFPKAVAMVQLEGRCGEIVEAPIRELEKFDPSYPYRTALYVVDPGASNASGMIRSMNRCLDYIWAEARDCGQGTDYVNKHPVITLFLSQLAQVNGVGPIDFAAFNHAYDRCVERLNELASGQCHMASAAQ